MEPSPISTGQLTINTTTPVGYHVGTLTKQGAFVKSWKTRHFSLTWNYLSYFDPTSKALLASIPLAQCTHVAEGVEKPWSFLLVSDDRTYSFVSMLKRHKEEWMKLLSIMISAHHPDIKMREGYEALQTVALHTLSIRHGTEILCKAHKTANHCMINLLNSLFELIEAFSRQRLDRTELKQKAEKLKAEVINMKNVIPVTHRFQPEKVDFDITLEQREITKHLKILCKEQNPHKFPDCEDDIKPFIINLMAECLTINSVSL